MLELITMFPLKNVMFGAIKGLMLFGVQWWAQVMQNNLKQTTGIAAILGSGYFISK